MGQLHAKIDELNQILADLQSQIQVLKGVVRQRESEIQGMHDRVRDAEVKCEESLKEHHRRTREIEA